jgi:hypothetical protein
MGGDANLCEHLFMGMIQCHQSICPPIIPINKLWSHICVGKYDQHSNKFFLKKINYDIIV